MFSRSYYPSRAGSVIIPASPYPSYAGSGYAGSAYGGSYYGGGHYPAPMSAPMMMPSYHHPPAYHGSYGYGGAHMPYYGGVTPTVVMSGSGRRHRRSSRRHSGFFAF